MLDAGQNPERPSVSQGIMDNIHAPAFSRATGSRGWSAMQRHVFPSPHPPPQRQPVEAIQATHSFAVHEPALASQQHPDALIPKAGLRMSQIPNAQSQGRWIFGRTLAIPRCPAELGEATGLRATHRERGANPVGQFPAAGGP